MRTRVRGVAACCYLPRCMVAPAAQPSPTLDRIKADGAIHLRVPRGRRAILVRDRDGSVRGYSVELCTRVAAAIQKQLGLAKLKVEWTPLDAANRLDAVAKGRVDIECGTTTITLSRYERVDFSLPIFVDGATRADCGGGQARALADLKRQADRRDPRHDDRAGAQARAGGRRCEGGRWSRSRTARSWHGAARGRQGRRLRGRPHRARRAARIERRPEPSSQLLDSDFSFEPYALVVRRDDPDFRLAVNRALVELYRSGDIDAIFYRWLGALGRPGPLLNSMFYLNTLPE